MKKTSKVLGALALSAAMAVGTAMPAFAAAPDFSKYGDEGTDTADPASKQGTMGTTAWMTATTYQIDATVPLNIAMVGDMAGGQMMTPHEGVYRITNNNDQASLYVTQVDVKLNPDREAGASTAPEWTPAHATSFKVNPDLAQTTIGGNPIKPLYGTISAQMTAGELNTVVSADPDADKAAAANAARSIVEASAYDPFLIVGNDTPTITVNSFSKGGGTAADHMEIGKADGTTGANELGLRLDVASSALENAYDENTGFVKVFKITYTVKAPQFYTDEKDGTDFFNKWDMYDPADLQGKKN